MKYTHTLLALFLAVSSLHAERLHKTTLNDGWMFSIAGSKSEMVNLPHTWNTDSYEVRNYLRGEGQYKRNLMLPDTLAGKRIFLKVDAASKTMRLLVNGHEMPMHVGGYSAACYDITEHVTLGSENTIEMLVDNATDLVPPTSADFTFQGGVYRDVWLITTARQHFSLTDHGAEGIYVSTPKVTDNEAEISVRATLCNEEQKAVKVVLKTDVYAPDGTLVASEKKNSTLPTEGQTIVSSFKVAKPQLWSPEEPRLYRVVTSIMDRKGTVLDRSWYDVGLRYYSFHAKEGFFLNGKPYKLHGMCRHQDQKPYGVALSEEQHRRDFRMMKEMGVNFIRISHYPQDDALLEMCDREGMLAWEEIPIVNIVPEEEAFADNCESMLRDMIRQHYNHPSVIMWGYMNEILLKMPWSNGKMQQPVLERTLALAHRLEKVVHEEDHLRLSTMAFHGSDDYNKVGLGDITNVVGWNLYQGWYGGDFSGFEKFLAGQTEKHPTHPMIVSEYGAGSDRRIHSFSPKCFDFSMEYHQLYAEHYLPVIENTPYVMGGTYWNLIDFSSASREESMPHINNKGLLYSDRTPKDLYYYFQATWRKDIPVLHIATRDWPSRVRMEDEPTQPVRVYSNQPEVELLLDGKSLGKQKTSNCTAIFHVPFHQGDNVLTATANGTTDAHKVRTDIIQFPSSARKGTGNGAVFAINVGSNCYFTSEASGLTWVPDREYTPGCWGHIGGKQLTSTSEVAGTPDVPLYQSMLTGQEAYQLDVPDGIYELELFYHKKVGEGEKSAYLLGKEADAKARAIRIRRTVEVRDSHGITIHTDEEGGECLLAAIILRQL